jgi:hypothetical protein
MKVLPFDCSDDEITALVIEWSELLAKEKYQEALDLLYAGSRDQQKRTAWSADILEKNIKFRGPVFEQIEDEIFKVTSHYDAKLPEDLRDHTLEVDRQNPLGQDKRIYDGMVHYDLPLNGYWSDLTARFQIRKVAGGIALELLDIHTL